MTSANLDYCGIVKLIRALVDANACTEAEAQKVARRIAARIGADILSLSEFEEVLTMGASKKNCPCKVCKRYPNCPSPCYPKRDWERGAKKRKKRTTQA